MVTLFLRQGENGKQVLLSFPTTTPAEKEDHCKAGWPQWAKGRTAEVG